MKHVRSIIMSVLALVTLTSPGIAIADPTVTIVMTGLDNPRGLAFGPDGALYVAEAGRGGQGPCVVVAGQTFCYGATGAVSRLRHGIQERVAIGFPSVAHIDGTRAEGPNGIAMLGIGSAHVTIGLEADPAIRNMFRELAGFGWLVHVPASGEWRFVVDIAGYEATVNPDPRIVDSNPFGLLAVPGGHVVTDAGGNSLLRVDANGDISLLAVFHNFHSTDTDSVPTSVALGPDGAYYVGELTGAPFPDHAANIYRVVPGQALGQAPEVFLTGFKAIIGIAFDGEGNLYVLQHSTGPTMLTAPGVLVRVAPDGTRTTVLGELTRPTGLAIGPDGALYVSHRGMSAGNGEVLRVQPWRGESYRTWRELRPEAGSGGGKMRHAGTFVAPPGDPRRGLRKRGVHGKGHRGDFIQ